MCNIITYIIIIYAFSVIILGMIDMKSLLLFAKNADPMFMNYFLFEEIKIPINVNNLIFC